VTSNRASSRVVVYSEVSAQKAAGTVNF